MTDMNSIEQFFRDKKKSLIDQFIETQEKFRIKSKEFELTKSAKKREKAHSDDKTEPLLNRKTSSGDALDEMGLRKSNIGGGGNRGSVIRQLRQSDIYAFAPEE